MGRGFPREIRHGAHEDPMPPGGLHTQEHREWKQVRGGREHRDPVGFQSSCFTDGEPEALGGGETRLRPLGLSGADQAQLRVLT